MNTTALLDIDLTTGDPDLTKYLEFLWRADDLCSCCMACYEDPTCVAFTFQGDNCGVVKSGTDIPVGQCPSPGVVLYNDPYIPQDGTHPWGFGPCGVNGGTLPP